jgi:DNA primase
MNAADPARLVAAHREAVDFYRQHLLSNETARHYLALRGLATLALPDLPWHVAVDQPWRVGYAPSAWAGLTHHLTRIGYTTDELLAAGLARQSPSGRVYDTFRDRIMFPIRNAAGDSVAFTGRALHPDERTPKYLNSPTTSIFHKRQTLYGMAEQASRLADGAVPVIVEGPLDVITVWLAYPDDAGLPRAALATCGTSLSNEHVDQLLSLPGTHRQGITVAYDPDPAGVSATERAWALLHTAGISLRAAVLPGSTDPADLANQPGGVAALREGLGHRARTLLEAVIEHRLRAFHDRHAHRPDSAELRVAALRSVADLLTHITADDARRIVERVAELTGTSIEAVTAVVLTTLDRNAGARAPHPVAHPPPDRRDSFAQPRVPPAPPSDRGGHPVNAARRRRTGRR